MMKLNNGATVIESHHSEKYNRTTVIAKWHGDHPFVTWRTDSDGNAYLGHYFETLAAAVADFQERTK